MASYFSSLDLANLEESAESTAGLLWGSGNFLLKSESPAKKIPKGFEQMVLSRGVISLSSWNSNKLCSGKLTLAVANPPFGWEEYFSMSYSPDSQLTCGVVSQVSGQFFHSWLGSQALEAFAKREMTEDDLGPDLGVYQRNSLWMSSIQESMGT